MKRKVFICLLCFFALAYISSAKIIEVPEVDARMNLTIVAGQPPAAGGGCPDLGITATGGTPATSGYSFAIKITPASTCSVNTLNHYTRAAADTTNIKLGLWADDVEFDQPGAILQSCTISSVDTTPAWESCSITETELTGSTDYWIGYQGEASAYYYHDDAAAVEYDDQMVYATFGNWYTSATATLNRKMSTYASYE